MIENMAVRRKKGKHRVRMRSSTRNVLIIIYVAIIMLSMLDLYNNVIEKNTYEQENTIFEYMNKFNQDYKVYLKKNKYMSEEYLGMDQVYVTDLIKNVTVNYDYTFEGKGEKTDRINATYKVSGKMKSTYSTDGKETEIWSIEKDILNEKDVNTQEQILQINEQLEINLDEYNKLLENFSNEYGIAISSVLEVTFSVNITTYVNGQMILDNYSNSLEISMGEKTTRISGKSNDEKGDKVIEKETITEDSNRIREIVCFILIAISAYQLIKVLRTRTANYISNEFKRELNQILNSYSDSIVKVDSRIDVSDSKVIELNDIEELVKLSEEIFKPILYYQIPNEKQAWFCLTNENECYIYVLK